MIMTVFKHSLRQYFCVPIVGSCDTGLGWDGLFLFHRSRSYVNLGQRSKYRQRTDRPKYVIIFFILEINTMLLFPFIEFFKL